MSQYKFSGHETFHCRHFWLKKGYDFNQLGGDQRSNDAVVRLGVGKNMVTSIHYWMKAFKVTNSESSEITDFGHFIFSSNGKDPYLEDIGTLYMLHYNLMTNLNQASIYSITFEEFRKTRIDSEFTAELLFEFAARKLRVERLDYSEKSLRNDIKVFLRTYQTATKRGSKSIEDDFASVLLELNFVNPIQDTFINAEQVFRIRYDEQPRLSKLIFLHALLDRYEGQESISVKDIQRDVSDKFLCNRDGTEKKLNDLSDSGYLVYKQDAGRKEIQFKSNLNKWDVLKKYYDEV